MQTQLKVRKQMMPLPFLFDLFRFRFPRAALEEDGERVWHLLGTISHGKKRQSGSEAIGHDDQETKRGRILSLSHHILFS